MNESVATQIEVLKSFALSENELVALDRLITRASMWWPQNNKLNDLCEQLNALRKELGGIKLGIDDVGDVVFNPTPLFRNSDPEAFDLIGDYKFRQIMQALAHGGSEAEGDEPELPLH